MTVPEGTIDEVLDWVDNDPARAQEALHQEYAGPNRSTLITKLEAIASREDEDEPMTDETMTDQDEPEVAEAQPPTDVEVFPDDEATVIQTPVARDPEVEISEDDNLIPVAETTEADEEPEQQPIEAEQVEFLQVASGTHGAIVALNGTSYAMTAQMAVALKQGLDKAVSGLTL